MKKTITCLLLCAFALSIFTSSASAASYRYEYDANNRLIRVYQVGTNVVYELTYDKNGNLLKTVKTMTETLITNLTATTGYNSVSLKWTASTAVTGYKVYQNGVYKTTIGKVTSYSVSSLAAGTYTFSLVPISATGDGTMVTTNPVQVSSPPPTPPPTGGGGGGITPGDPDPAM